MKLVVTMKTFLLSLCHLSERLSSVTYKHRAEHLTPMMWFDIIRWQFHFIRGRLYSSNCVKLQSKWCDTKLHFIWNSYLIHEHNMRDKKFTQMLPQGKVGGQKKYAYSGTYMLFVEQPVVSLSLYNGAIKEGPVISNRTHLIKVDQESVITDSHLYGFTSKLHILHKSDNIVHLSICLPNI